MKSFTCIPILAVGLLSSVAVCPPTAMAQEGVLVKETRNETSEEFGGIVEVLVIDKEGGNETVALEEPLGVLGALDEAGSRLGGNLREGTILCFEVARETIENRSDTNVNAAPNTIFVGNAEEAPCDVLVVTGQLEIIITHTEAHIFFYRMQVHLGARGSCALQLTRFSYDSQTDETRLTWESLPQSRYTIEVSNDMRQWAELKRDIPSQGTTTTESTAIGNPGARESYFRVRLHLDSLPDPSPAP